MKIKLFIMCFIFSCSLCNAQNNDIDFLPLSLNNEWNYYSAYSDSATDVLYRKSITDTLRIDNEKYFVLTTTLLEGNSSWSDTIRRDTDGRIIKYDEGKEQIWFDFLAPDNSSYTFYRFYHSYVDTYYVKVTRNVAYSCEAGKYENCIQLFFDIPGWVDDEQIFVFCNNVGIVEVMHGGEGPYMALKDMNINLSSIENDNNRNILSGYNLRQNYPNPFNPKTVISWQLPVSSHVELSIYNVLGQKVATLVDKKQSAGTHQIEWNASGLASGIYLYHLKVNDHEISKKMVLMK
jgi:hypothetical protein